MTLHKIINVEDLGHGIIVFLLNEACYNIPKKKRRKIAEVP